MQTLPKALLQGHFSLIQLSLTGVPVLNSSTSLWLVLVIRIESFKFPHLPFSLTFVREYNVKITTRVI
jgi:hypothetical protein